MDVDEIRTFLAIAETGSFTQAGRRLHRSQPAISRRIDLLEHELGVPLLERIRGRVRLTEAGSVFLPHAETALAALKDARDAVSALKSGIQGEVSLALVGTLADTQIVDVLRKFARRADKLRVHLRTAGSTEVTNLVRRGDATLGLRYFTSGRSDVVELPAGSESMLVVASPDHSLRGRRVGSTQALAQERWIGFPPVSGDPDSSGHLLARLLIRAGLSADNLTLIDSLTAQKRLAQAGFGLALVPESSVRDELRQGTLVVLNVPAMKASIPISALHRRNGYLSPAARALLKLLTNPSR